jgi:hypothetical protein
MQVQQYPKPTYKRQKAKVQKNPVPTINDICEVCGKPYAAQHEIFFGEKYRRLSQIYGLTKRLCYDHHQGKDGPHFNKAIDDQYKQLAQREFEKVYGRERWMQEVGKSYL